MSKKLSIKHKAFADEYLSNGMNGTRAYMSVYKSVKKEASAQANSSKLLSKAIISDYIASEQKKTSEKLQITRENKLQQQNQIGNAYEELLALASKGKLDKDDEAKFTRLIMIVKASDSTRATEFIAGQLGWSAEGGDESTEYDVNIVIKSKNNDKDED